MSAVDNITNLSKYLVTIPPVNFRFNHDFLSFATGAIASYLEPEVSLLIVLYMVDLQVFLSLG
jgi:putative membrane protein